MKANSYESVIASNIGGHREIVQDRLNGLLFESESVPDLIVKCRELIENGEFRVELGARLRQWAAANRDWDVLARKYVGIYEKLTAPIAGFHPIPGHPGE